MISRMRKNSKLPSLSQGGIENALKRLNSGFRRNDEIRMIRIFSANC